MRPDLMRPVHVVQLTDAHLFADPAGSMLGLKTRDSLRHVVAQVQREQPLVDLLLCTGTCPRMPVLPLMKRFVS